MYRISELLQLNHAVAFAQIEAAVQLPAAQPNPNQFQLPTIPEEDNEDQEIPIASLLGAWPS